MANLKFIEECKLEELFGMDSGYVLDFSDKTFAYFFSEIGIEINDPKYTPKQKSSSKANRLRGFWAIENTPIVKKAIQRLIDHAEHLANDSGNSSTEKDQGLILECRNIANKLTGETFRTDVFIPEKNFLEVNKEIFLDTDFGEIDCSKLPIEICFQAVLKERVREAEVCLKHNAPLSAIFMAGSILEGVLLGVAQKYPKKFNSSPACPKDAKRKPKKIVDWKLSELIDVGREINLLGEDVKKFSHVLRDFRNYIHPHQQATTKFMPDNDTAKMCMHVLHAVFSDLKKYKPSE